MSKRKKKGLGGVRVVYYKNSGSSRTRPVLGSKVNWENLGRLARMGKAAARHGRRAREHLLPDDRQAAERPVQGRLWSKKGRSSGDASCLVPDPEKLAKGLEAIQLLRELGREGAVAELRRRTGQKEAE